MPAALDIEEYLTDAAESVSRDAKLLAAAESLYLALLRLDCAEQAGCSLDAMRSGGRFEEARRAMKQYEAADRS